MNPVLGSYYELTDDIDFTGHFTLTVLIKVSHRKNNKRGRFGIRKLIKTTKKIVIN